jgi:hypothetical protein
MNSRKLFLIVAAGLAVASRASAQTTPDNPPPPPQPPPAQQGVTVLTRGPVHEAYAEPSEQRPEPTLVVPKQPPNPIDEMPPDQKPEGDNVVWIPGYWGWDADSENFLWVSGFWRVPPPDHQWVPGTWQEVEGGWQWTPGYWAVAGQEDVQFVAMPPPSLEEGPSAPAPDETSTYVPGCWVYRQARFWWRPGFWIPFHPGWLWTPAHYVWTPAGCHFVEGYWDRPLEARGLLFSPVQIDTTLLTRAGFTYVPQYVVQPDFLLTALFVHPTSCHYYFGDYFDARYQKHGFVPWVDYKVSRVSFDANFSYYRQMFAHNESWERGLREVYAGRFGGTVPRPPRTLVQQHEVVRNLTVNNTANVAINRNVNITNVQNVSVVAPLAQVHNTRVTNLSVLAGQRAPDVKTATAGAHVIRLQEVPRERRVQEQKAAVQFHATAQQRREVQGKFIAEGTAPVRVQDQARQARIALPPPPAHAKVDVHAKVDIQAQPAPHVPPPTAPKPPPHVEQPIPQHQPPPPARPPAPKPPPPKPPPHQPGKPPQPGGV